MLKMCWCALLFARGSCKSHDWSKQLKEKGGRLVCCPSQGGFLVLLGVSYPHIHCWDVPQGIQKRKHVHFIEEIKRKKIKDGVGEPFGLGQSFKCSESS